MYCVLTWWDIRWVRHMGVRLCGKRTVWTCHCAYVYSRLNEIQYGCSSMMLSSLGWRREGFSLQRALTRHHSKSALENVEFISMTVKHLQLWSTLCDIPFLMFCAREVWVGANHCNAGPIAFSKCYQNRIVRSSEIQMGKGVNPEGMAIRLS